MNQTEPVSEAIPQPLPLASSTQLSGRRATILLVEDETLVREIMFETLAWAGYRVLKASNAAEARTAFRRCRKVVGLLLADVVLPDQNGKDLAQEFRMICPDLRAILVSGYPGVFTLATLLVVAFRAPCSAPSAPVAIAIVLKRLDIRTPENRPRRPPLRGRRIGERRVRQYPAEDVDGATGTAQQSFISPVQMHHLLCHLRQLFLQYLVAVRTWRRQPRLQPSSLSPSGFAWKRTQFGAKLQLTGRLVADLGEIREHHGSVRPFQGTSQFPPQINPGFAVLVSCRALWIHDFRPGSNQFFHRKIGTVRPAAASSRLLGRP